MGNDRAELSVKGGLEKKKKSSHCIKKMLRKFASTWVLGGNKSRKSEITSLGFDRSGD